MLYKILCGTGFQILLSLYKNLSFDWTHACHLLNVIPNIQVLQPIKKCYASLTQKLQAREPYLLNMPHNNGF